MNELYEKAVFTVPVSLRKEEACEFIRFHSGFSSPIISYKKDLPL